MKIPSNIINSLTNKKIVLLGLGKEGLSTYHFLRQLLPNQPLAVADENHQLPEDLINDKHLITHLGDSYLNQLAAYELIFISPGIPSSITQVQSAVEAGAKLSSNMQLFLEIIQEIKQSSTKTIAKLPTPVIIGVTGTKGKSTTSSMIHHMLDLSGVKSTLIGNIGQPALSMINNANSNDCFVIEMSSHQLSTLSISPDIAVIQEITSEHLDYYKDTDEYIRSKEAITKYQKVEQYIIFNPTKQNTTKIASLSPGNRINFIADDLKQNDNDDIQVYLKSQKLTFRDINVEEPIVEVSSVPLLGKHNLENVAPSIIVGKLFGLNSTQISSAISSFTPLPHRLEKVALVDGVTYVNDSMATMPDAAISALSCFGDSKIVLLAGGHERNQDFVPLAKTIVASNVKAMALFPANGERLWQEVQKELQSSNSNKTIQTKVVYSMPEALQFAKKLAKSDDVVLLSPGAASFGIFKDYADRGEQFRELVRKNQDKDAIWQLPNIASNPKQYHPKSLSKDDQQVYE